MTRLNRSISIGLLAILVVSCQKKKLTEVVEVPLPAAEEKLRIGHPDEAVADPGTFELYKLPYEYDALAPHIDAMTMEMHYSKHYLTYTNNLNRALDSSAQGNLAIEEIFKGLDLSDSELRNNLGGYYNHTLFFETIAPKKGGEPTGNAIAAAITKDFGSFAAFRQQFENAANERFGSGWAWLLVDRSGRLWISSTPNQDNPLMPQANPAGKPVLGIDVWEHAYYLGYQYKRQKYIEAFFNVIDWDKVNEKFEDATRK